MCDLTGCLLYQPVSQVIMHRNHEYKVDLVTSVVSVSRRKSENERRCSLDVMKVFKMSFTILSIRLLSYTSIC